MNITKKHEQENITTWEACEKLNYTHEKFKIVGYTMHQMTRFLNKPQIKKIIMEGKDE